MISKVNFTGKEAVAPKILKKAENTASNYVSAGKIYSAEEREAAEMLSKKTRHPYVSPFSIIQKAEDVKVDFVSETAPHRFNQIG
ncbi:hypothetical protein J6O86_00705 [bacterium]|nr:hypothetical protein [bacterium]